MTEAGKKFVVTVYDNTCKLAGTVKNAGRWIIRAVDPASKTVLKSAFLEPRVINAYTSGRVVHLHNKSAILDDEPEESTLYIVSDNYNVNLFNENDSLLETFEPVYLSVVIDPVKMEELNFGEEEKKLAKMYFYNDDKLFWMELEDDINEHPDTVTTLISRSGNYAVGIELLPSNDKDAPEIQDYYPQIFKELYSGDKIWARLYEPLTGVGLDFSKTNIMIDGIEVEALWNPVENIISFALEDSLETGEYAFTITAVDLNGNTNQVSGSFYYSSITTNSHLVNAEVPLTITCYPNPVVDFLIISIRSVSMDPIDIGIYNSMGQLVSNMMSVIPVSDVSEVKWNRTDMNNQRVKAGLYFVRYKQGNSVLAKKIILL